MGWVSLGRGGGCCVWFCCCFGLGFLVCGGLVGFFVEASACLETRAQLWT